MQRLGIYQKVIVLFAATLLSLAVLFGVGFGILKGIPDWQVISSGYVTADAAAFDLEAILAHPDVQQVEHMEWEGFTDAVAGITAQDLFRFAIPGPDLNKAEAAEYLHGGLEDIYENKGETVTSSTSSTTGSDTTIRSKMSNGKICFTQTRGNLVMQVATPDDTELGSYFQRFGMIEVNSELTGGTAWLARNRTLLLVGFVLIFAVLWVIGIFCAGTWIATVPPQKSVQPVSGAELQARLESINSEEVPFSVTVEGAGRLRAEWRLSGQWEGLLASLALEDVYIIEFKLNEKSKTVTAIEKRRSLTKEAGAYHLGASSERFRGITFFHLRKHKVSGLAYRDGKLEVSSFDYQFDVLEMKMPLIEIVTGSGWA
ncbi:MAG: hypothetical protein ABIF77_16445, partial [bacterium]